MKIWRTIEKWLQRVIGFFQIVTDTEGEGGVVVEVVLAAIHKKSDAKSSLRGSSELIGNSAKNERERG